MFDYLLSYQKAVKGLQAPEKFTGCENNLSNSIYPQIRRELFIKKFGLKHVFVPVKTNHCSYLIDEKP